MLSIVNSVEQYIVKNNIKKVKILWFSRHEMSVEQLKDLKRIFGDIEIHQVSKTIKHVVELKKEIKENDVIAIVAPLLLQKEFLEISNNKPVILSKSKRVFPEGSQKEKFLFDGWFRLKKIDIVVENL